MEVWFWFWLAAAVALSVAEIFTAGFFMLPFGIGAAVAAALAYFNVALAWQWTAFLGVSALLLFVLRRFSDQMTHEPPQKVAGDRLMGREGSVIEKIDNHLNTGRVRVDREEWVADSEDDVVIEAGSRVKVTGVVGAHLVVVPAEKPAHTA
jgi:membrane protein implicated in regulation of membrane protease activity